MKNEIKISILVPSRRPDLLREYMLITSGMAKNPEKIEWIIRIDDDDEESIVMLKTDRELKNKIPNFKTFVGPRVGFLGACQTYLWLCDRAQGDILVLFGDDHKSIRQNWDEIIYFLINLYKTPIVIGGYHFAVVCSKEIFKHIWHDDCDKADLLIIKEAEQLSILVKTKTQPLFDIRRNIPSILRTGWRQTEKVLKDLYDNKLKMRDINNFTLKELICNPKLTTNLEPIKQISFKKRLKKAQNQKINKIKKYSIRKNNQK